MNDQELDDELAGFRDDVPEMSEGAFLLGKLRLTEATTPVREALPVLTPITVNREVIDPERRRSPPKRRTPWIMTAASVAVLAVAATVVLNVGSSAPPPEEISVAYPPAPPLPGTRTDSDGVGVALPPPGEVYNAAGDLADHVSDPPQAPGQYLFMAEEDWGKAFQVGLPVGPPGASYDLGNVGKGFWNEWVPADRSGVWQVSRDVAVNYANEHFGKEPVPPSMISGRSALEGTFRAAGGDYSMGYNTSDRGLRARGNGWLMPTEAFITSLPRDPQALYQRLSKDAEKNLNPQVMALHMAGALLSRPVPADLRRALYKALSYHPWLTVDKNAKTKDGRPAVSLRAEDQFIKTDEEILIDPANGRLIGIRSTLREDSGGLKAGLVLTESIVHWSVVNQMGATS
jgi:hypothetical protein